MMWMMDGVGGGGEGGGEGDGRSRSVGGGEGTNHEVPGTTGLFVAQMVKPPSVHTHTCSNARLATRGKDAIVEGLSRV